VDVLIINMHTKPKIHLGSFEEYRISVSRRIEWMLKKFYKNPRNISETQVKKDQSEINAYENYAALKPINEEQAVILDDDKIGTSTAEKALLEGKFFWEHAAAGEATRLGLGTKYLLELDKFSIDEIVSHIRDEAVKEARTKGLSGKNESAEKKRLQREITKKKVLEAAGGDPRQLMPISLGNRHMLQMAYDVIRIAKQNKTDPKKALSKQSALIVLNEQTAEEIIEEFRRFNFFSLDTRKIYFMVQRSFHGMYIKEGNIFYDQTTEKNKRLHNHGQMVMQKAHDNVIFRVDPKNIGEKKYISSREWEDILGKHDDMLSYNVEDLGYLTCAVDLPSLALALALGKKGYSMVMEIVAQNPLKPQKGGACFFDNKLGRAVMVETNQLKNIKLENIKHLNKNFNHYPNPIESFRAIKSKGLPITFEVKTGFDQSGEPQEYLYACPVQGDTNFLVKTAFVMRKNLKPIYNWKSPATTPLAVKAMFEQEAQAGFKEFVWDVKKGKYKNY
jgi:hypothetical protein